MDSQLSLSFSMDTTSESISGTTPQSTALQSNSVISQNHTASSNTNSKKIIEVPPDKMLTELQDCPSTSSLSANHNAQKQTDKIESPFTDEVIKSGTKKCVIFDTVTVYHFNRSQGFTSIPSQGGSTLGMKRKHFLRRRLSVDLYEEVRRRSRREILLKIRLDKRKQNERLRRELLDECDNEMKDSSSNSPVNTITSDDDDDWSFSDQSDISDSELESEGYIFLQPIGVKLRRSLLRASGVSRIDPKEKKECNIIRDSRDRAGCGCVGQCDPEYCECSRLGVNCHVDRVSFPCGCVPSGCLNPLGRTEFDIARVRCHFQETVSKPRGSSASSENDPSNSDSSFELAIDDDNEISNDNIDDDDDAENEGLDIDDTAKLVEGENFEQVDVRHKLGANVREQTSNQTSSVETC